MDAIVEQTDLIRVEGLRTYFYTRHGVARSVDGVDFRLRRGEHLVGEAQRDEHEELAFGHDHAKMLTPAHHERAHGRFLGRLQCLTQ